MGQRTEYLVGTVEAVTFQNEENGFAVLTLASEDGDLVCVVGPLAGSAPGEQLTLEGRYIEHTTYGVQFEASSCSYRMPETETAILKYLSSGVLPGIGPATARRIVDRYGEQSLEVLATDAEKLGDIKGFSLQKAKLAGQRFMELFGIREAVAGLARFGLSADEALTMYRQFGKNTLETVLENPYLLCGFPLYITFGRADAVAHHLSIQHNSQARIRAAILYTLRHNLQNGHTCLPMEKLLITAEQFFEIPREMLELELSLLCDDNEAQIVSYNNIDYIYLPDALHAEMIGALRIKEKIFPKSKIPSSIEKKIRIHEELAGITYAPLQKEAIAEALCNHIMVITGGPGTGKTTTVNAIISLYEQETERVLLAAPTGRAAKRLSELTGRKASTIHRLLEVEYMQGSEQPRFKRNEKNPLRCDVLIVDEMSMVDAILFECLLAALKPGCRLILVGDADQLPSVGPGNVLKGMLESKIVPAIELKEIFRQAAESLIVSNAHRIVEGQLPQKGGREDDYFFLKAYGTSCQKLVCELIGERLPASYSFSPMEDIQVLCPGRKGPLGTEVLNSRLQELLNPAAKDKPEIHWGGKVLRLGDKIMQVRNNYDVPYARTNGEPGAGAFNGDIGYIETINPSSGAITVFCEDRHVYYTTENLNELELAYAVTIHKSQGSEFEAIVIPVAEVPKKLRYRNLLYTGVTRARRLCILVGEESIVEQMVRNGRKNTRFSCFSEFLKDDSLI